jgi:PleD family two-component response regulator
VLERLRDAVPPPITFSAGVAAWRPGEGPDQLASRADERLYEAKHQGRNRIVTEASSIAPSMDAPTAR